MGVTAAAGIAPKVTVGVARPLKPLPVTVTSVPPAVDPVFGLTEVTAGTGAV